MDRNLINLFNDPSESNPDQHQNQVELAERGGLSKFTLSKRISNLVRTQNSLFLTYLDKAQKRQVKVINDKS